MQRPLYVIVVLLSMLHIVFSTEAFEVFQKILTAVCDASPEESIAFYSSIREDYATIHDAQFPVTDSNNEGTLGGLATRKTMAAHENLEIVPFFDGIWDIIYPHYFDLRPEYFEWCLFLYNGSEYGCRNGSREEGTPGFMVLKVFKMFDYKGVTDPLTLVVFNDNQHVAVLEESLLVVTIRVPWHNNTIGVFYSLSVIENSESNSIEFFPEQQDLFLVAGEKKIFQVDTISINSLSNGGWLRGGELVQKVVNVFSDNCTQLTGEHTSPCSNETHPLTSSFMVHPITGENCETGDSYRSRRREHHLSFNSPTINDTGNYSFVLYFRDYREEPIAEHTIYIPIVIAEFPPDQTWFGGAAANLSCVVKAPLNSSVDWFYDGQMITYSNHKCNKVIRDSQAIDDTFALYSITVEICSVEELDSGSYICSISTPEHTVPIEQKVLISVNSTGIVEHIPSLYQHLPKIVGACVTVGVLVLVALTVGIVLMVVFIRRSVRQRQRRMLKHRPSNHLLLKPQCVKGETYINLCSPDIVNKEELDFPRENLKLEIELGRGKFGRVFRGKAHGMVAALPNVNTVAVKTTLNAGSYTENTRLMNELQLLKILHKKPHKNICNLLGCCFEANVPFLILEYACHGNLKKYLVACRSALEASGQEVAIDATPTAQSNGEANLSQLAIVGTSATNPLGVGTLSSDSKEGKSMADILSTGAIRESQLCDYALQIAAGLKHLSDLKIVHCDIAARNILIAEGNLLKICDFGNGKETVAPDAAYQNLVIPNDESIIPARWAAPELLDGESHSLTTDMWAYAVTVWEIASYGSEPFSEIKLGVSLSPLSEHIRQGSKLPAPAGLSNYIYRQLCECWSIDEQLRPSAEEMVDFFKNINPGTLALEDMLEEVL